QRAVYFIDHHIVRKIRNFFLKHLLYNLLIRIEEFFDILNGGGFAHPLHKNETRKNHTDFDGQNQIKKYGQEKCRQQHDHVHAIAFQQGFKMPPLTHVPGYHHQNSRQAGQRNQLGNRSKKQHHQQQKYRVNNSRQRSSSTIFNIGSSTGNGSGGGNSTEQSGENITGSLRHQLHVGTVRSEERRVGKEG